MYNIQIINEDEDQKVTMEFISSKRNWSVADQKYRIPGAEKRKTNLARCKIYWRGKYLILEDFDGIIQYWDFFPYCFLKQAVEFMELDEPAEWKTMDKLISLRMGIRQTEVNLCGYVETILVGEKMTLDLYNKFMRFARKQDKEHHGSHTF